jgi:hypothetical protein
VEKNNFLQSYLAIGARKMILTYRKTMHRGSTKDDADEFDVHEDQCYEDYDRKIFDP